MEVGDQNIKSSCEKMHSSLLVSYQHFDGSRARESSVDQLIFPRSRFRTQQPLPWISPRLPFKSSPIPIGPLHVLQLSRRPSASSRLSKPTRIPSEEFNSPDADIILVSKECVDCASSCIRIARTDVDSSSNHSYAATNRISPVRRCFATCSTFRIGQHSSRSREATRRTTGSSQRASESS